MSNTGPLLKYCNDTSCEFWEENPEGTTKGKYCGECRAPLVTENPKNQSSKNEKSQSSSVAQASSVDNSQDINDIQKFSSENIQGNLNTSCSKISTSSSVESGFSDNKNVQKTNTQTHQQIPDVPGSSNDSQESISRLVSPQYNILTEIDSNETRYFNIHFATLIQEDYWKDISDICLRIGTKYFHNFNTSIVRFDKISEVELECTMFVIICGTLRFPLSQFCDNNAINFPYKYLIYFQNGEEHYENLKHHGSNFNRYFFLQGNNIQKERLVGQSHQQYDMMIIPEFRRKEITLSSVIKDSVSYITSYGENSPPYDFYERRLITLKVLLPKYDRLGHFMPCDVLEDFITYFTSEISQLSNFYFQEWQMHGGNVFQSDEYDKPSKLAQDWIVSLTRGTNAALMNPMHIIHVFYLVCCLLQLYQIECDKVNSYLVNMIDKSIEPILKAESFIIGDYIVKSAKFSKKIRTSVEHFIFTKVKANKYREKIFPMLILYHRISHFQNCEHLHEELSYNENPYWGLPNEYSKCLQDELYFTDCKKYLELVQYDKLLPYSIVMYTLSEKNVSNICDYFFNNAQNYPLSAIMSVLMLRLFNRDSKYFGSLGNRDKLITEVLKSLHSGFQSDISKLQTNDICRLSRMFILFTKKIQNSHISEEQFFLCLKLLSNSLMYCDKRKLQSPKVDIQNFYKNFILSRYYSKYLGGNQIYKLQSELKFWQQVLDVNFPAKYEFHSFIENDLSNRFADPKISQQCIIELFIQLHNVEKQSHLLQEIFRKELTIRIQVVRPGERSNCVTQLSQQLSNPSQLPKLNSIFSKVLLDEEKSFEENSIKHFITWTSWATYFGLLNSGDIEQILSKEARNFLDDAASQFGILVEQIYDISITGENLMKIRDNTKYFSTLCQILQKDELNKLNNEKLQQCIEIYDWIVRQQELLTTFKALLERLQNIYQEDIGKFLCTDLQSEPLNTSCHLKKGISFRFHHIINGIIQFPKFQPMCQICGPILQSRIVIKLFDDLSIENISLKKNSFDIKIFYESIWVPVMKYSIDLLLKLIDQTILISTMCKYFTCTDTENMVISELTLLEHVVSYNGNSNQVDQDQLNSCAVKIIQYFSLQQCSDGASLIIQLKGKLGILGNFEIIQKLKDIKHTYLPKQLNSVNSKVCKAAEYLSSLSTMNLDVIKAIIDKVDFIIWVRSNLKDLNELKTFIDISLTNCGGNPVDIDRITCLSSVCTNFAPLIFQIDENTSYETLIARCKQVIESVERNKELTKLLREVGENVKFLEEMKQSHGSVQDSTLMQLDNIIKSGVFCLKVVESLDLSDIVSLSVDRDNGEKRIYSLDQLREFRSKVMLVVSKSEQPGVNAQTNSYENSQLFTHKLDIMTEIATIVIKLVECGYKDYLHYEMISKFDEDKSILEKQRLDIIVLLKKWKSKLAEARDRYYYLNYYTISQIVSLQNGIDHFNTDLGVKESEQFYHLLGLLNPEVTHTDIEQALEQSHKDPLKSSVKRMDSDKVSGDHANQSLLQAMQLPDYICGKPKQLSQRTSIACEEADFPDSLESRERQLAREVSGGAFELKLVIKGIVELKMRGNVDLEEDLLLWCMEHEGDSSDDIGDNSLTTNPKSISPLLTSTTPCLSKTDSHYPERLSDFHQLGYFLEEIFRSCGSKMRAERQLPYNMKSGTPNLVVIPANNIFAFVFSLYTSNNDKLPFPYYHEILICTTYTKLEEIEIFWKRALMDPDNNYMYIFCLIDVQNLKYEVAVYAVMKFRSILQQLDKTGKEEHNYFKYKLMLICSEEKEKFSYIASAFEDCKVQIPYEIPSDKVKSYLQRRLTALHRHSTLHSRDSAWRVDSKGSRVRFILSDSIGAGKSLHIRNLKLGMLNQGIVNEDEIEQAAVTVAIHGKQVSEEHLTEQLLSRNISGVEHGIMFHVDIASTVQFGIESILFKLLILGGICKSNGELWHCRQRDYYVIEMTLTSVQSTLSKFCRLFPNIQCVQPLDALGTKANIHTQTIDSYELKSKQYQRVTAYLKRAKDLQRLENFKFQPLKTDRAVPHLDSLATIIQHCGICDPSWAELRNFVSFLDKQLSDCDNSVFCSSITTGSEWMGFKSFVVKFMIHMSRDFALPSIRVNDRENIVKEKVLVEIIEKRRWENSSHPYIFFNPDNTTMTFLGFHISSKGHLVDSDNASNIIENNIIDPKLVDVLKANGVKLQENYCKLSKMEKIMKIASFMNTEWLADPDPGYVLTLDNMRKILAILMRFRCNIPVVIMGETGCGKTRLIQFMCSLQALQTGTTNMLILKVHGGTTERDVMCKVEKAEKLATHNYHNHNIDTVLFFDEANTSPAIGLIKEIMCDRRMYGRHISSDIRLQFIAACNPYRRHTKEMLHKLSTAGLGFFTKSTDTTDRLGDIPLRELVYRVMELPASMRPLVWDFGQLSNDVEKTYTREIVAKHLRDHNSPIEAHDDVVDAISEVLAGAHNYMRERKDECSFVSLRDVERAMRVMLWFYSNLHYFRSLETRLHSMSGLHDIAMENYSESLDSVTLAEKSTNFSSGVDSSQTMLTTSKLSSSIDSIADKEGKIFNQSIPLVDKIDFATCSLILSLAVCYRAKLEDREEFDKQIAKHMQPPLTQINDHKFIHLEIDRCQEIIINSMTVGANIAKNNALKENVFMMFVCIELKIPLFVIGKPGSSKSLAKSIISNSMQGNRCPDGSILQNFKQIQIMSYQCSQLSTADGIIGVFKSCKTLQRKTGSNKFTACVVLDEVGLAEDSPLLPLKVLHPLLEDNDYGSDEIEKVVEQDEVVSKRIPVPTTEEKKSKVETDDMMDRVAFIGISNWSLDPAKMNRGIMVARGDPDVDDLISSARGICRSDSIEIQISRSIKDKIPYLAEAYQKLTVCQNSQICGNQKRDYFGLRDFYSLIKMLVFICSHSKMTLNRNILEHVVSRNFGGMSGINPVKEFNQIVKLQSDEEQGPDSSPLGLIRANLTNLTRSFHGETRYLLLLTENYAALDILTNSQHVWPRQHDVQDIRVIFGSSFPSDQEYSAVCRNINRIKVCMESGKTIILLNLENLYESLYDALNQYYMEMNNQRYVDLGLGTHRMKCRVHNNFKLIVVADTETVRERFPTPLINRLEKHYLTMSTVLSENCVIFSKQLAEWAKCFATFDKNESIGYQRREYSVANCFIGFHDDTPPSIVFHVTNGGNSDAELDEIAVLERCQTLLLRMATTDAVLRVKNSLLSLQSDHIIAEYFKLHLGSLEEYLRHVLSSTCNEMTGSHLTLATTHSRLLTDRDVDQLRQRLSSDTDTDRIEIIILSLQQFQTELQYTREIQRFLRGESGIEGRECSHKKILLIQCERGADNAKLIACARHKTEDELKDWREEKKALKLEVYLVFLIQLSREVHGSKFVSFCGGEWNTVHIDDICSSNFMLIPSMPELINNQIFQIFDSDVSEKTQTTSPLLSQKIRLRQCIQPAASRLEESNGSEGRILDRIQDFVQLLGDEKYSNDVIQILCRRIALLLKEQHDTSDSSSHWIFRIANCVEIQSCGTFRKAINLHINSTITPLLSELIAFLDRNANLELAIYHESVPKCYYDLWHDILQDEQLCVLQYKDIISNATLLPRTSVPVLSDGAGGRFFKAKFPFSWLVQEVTSSIRVETKHLNVKTTDLWMSFESYFNETPLGGIMNGCLMNQIEKVQLIYLYLKDFIYMKIYPSSEEKYMVFECILLNCIQNMNYPNEMDKFEVRKTIDIQNMTVPKIHCAYEDSRQLISLFEQVFVLESDLGINIANSISQFRKSENPKLYSLELVLLEEILSLCSHSKERTSKFELAEKYVSYIRKWQPLVEEALCQLCKNTDTKSCQTKIRKMWNRIVAVQLFISHCTIEVGLEVTENSINRLFMILGETPDFASLKIINNVLAILSNCFKKLGKDSRAESDLRERFKYHATKFFISILTDLTFKYIEIDDENEKLIRLLMGFVTMDENCLSELLTEESSVNIFTKDGLDPSPAFRTFLLQMLIKHRHDVFKQHITAYLRETVSNFDDLKQRELHFLMIQSIEDLLHQQFKQCDQEKQYQLVGSQINSKRAPKFDETVVSYDLLEMIATLRFICIHISHWIIDSYDLSRINSSGKSPDQHKRRLIDDFKDMCELQGNENLHLLLLKNIYHQLGSETLHLITNNDNCSWIIPEAVMNIISELPTTVPDYFIIYGEEYFKITNKMVEFYSVQKKDILANILNTKKGKVETDLEYILYSVFQVVVKFFMTQVGNEVNLVEKFHVLLEYVNNDLESINQEVKNLTNQIATNNLGNGCLKNLQLNDRSRSNELFLARLIYHSAIMLSFKKYHNLFLPIALIYENPQVLEGKLFPTMMDDQFILTRDAITDGGKWYQCPNGHPYFIGDCGRPWVVDKCSECGSQIGGDRHRLQDNNEVLNVTRDKTQSGYLIGKMNPADNVLAGERLLSPASVKIIRVLMDLSFICSSCSKHSIDKSQALPSLVKGGLDDPRDLPNFFYFHLEKDVKDLTKLIGKNFEELIFIIHLILKCIMEAAEQSCDVETNLTSYELREKWESKFDNEYIQPILTSLHTDVHKQMEQVLSEKTISTNPLLRIVYERDEPDPNDPLPHLWRYRTIVSVEHFSQSFSTADVNTKGKCPLVDKFLREKNRLIVTRYLPDIVQLQKRMRDKFLHRLDKREAVNTTIKAFLDRTRNDNEKEWEEFCIQIGSLTTAWSMIGEDVRKNGRLKMEEALEQQEITPATCLAYLLPSSTGEGVLITSLTDYLVLIHNSFVHAYRDRVKESRSDKIPLHELNTSHVIEYEEHLQPLLLSHAHYSLALGQGSLVTYDFEGVEQQFMEQFIQSKPLIVAEYLRFEYTCDEYKVTMFEQLRHKIEQVELKDLAWKSIKKELNSLEVVCDVIQVLDMVIRILSSAGGNPEQKMSFYLRNVLKFIPDGDNPLQSRRAENMVRLKHTLSFRRLISIEKARKLCLQGQIPFPSLRDEFHKEVGEEERKQIENSCNNYPVEKMLVYLHEFILLFVQERDVQHKNYGLRETVEEYAEDMNWNLPDGFHHFPGSVKLSQCASAWAVLSYHQHRIDSAPVTDV